MKKFKAILSRTDRNDGIRFEKAIEKISELLTDDERADFYGFPKGCRVREGVKFYGIDHLKIGEYVYIGEDSKIDAFGGLEIGDHVTLAANVFIYTHSSHLASLNLSNEVGSSFNYRKNVENGLYFMRKNWLKLNG